MANDEKVERKITLTKDGLVLIQLPKDSKNIDSARVSNIEGLMFKLPELGVYESEKKVDWYNHLGDDLSRIVRNSLNDEEEGIFIGRMVPGDELPPLPTEYNYPDMADFLQELRNRNITHGEYNFTMICKKYNLDSQKRRIVIDSEDIITFTEVSDED